MARFQWKTATVLAFAAVWSLGLSSGARGATPQNETGDMPVRTARSLAKTLLAHVEAQALAPRSQDEYREAKRRLLERVEGRDPVNRAALYRAARDVLNTIDADGHSMLWSRHEATQFAAVTSPDDASRGEVVRIVELDAHRVLVVTPPAATYINAEQEAAYTRRLVDGIEAAGHTSDVCALVVDLTAQTGGNAYPPLHALASALSVDNTAVWVDRNDRREPVLGRELQRALRDGRIGAPALAAFRGRPIAVVTGPKTASAGEMLTMLFKGEANATTFGWPTYGMTTANITLELPDEATLVLSVSRYAFGHAAPIHGRIAPDVPANTAATHDAVVMQAAQWAASKNCAP